jgi:hypothetical protein
MILAALLGALLIVCVVALPGSGPERPTARIYWGAYVEGAQTYRKLLGGTWTDAPWDVRTVARFQSDAGKVMSIEHWGMCWTCAFDSAIATVVVGRGDIPAIDWSNDSSATDADIAAGKYDTQITAVAQAMKAFGHPMFLLFDEEMNANWYPYSPGVNGNTAADFVAMWRHIHDIFTTVGANNVTWVWCPNVDPDNTMTPMSEVYPGDDYVDWTGLNGYNWGNVNGNQWLTFSQVFSSSYNTLLSIAPGKPIMIGETASAEAGGSKARWIADLFTQLPTRFPRVNALLWFNWRIHQKGQWWPWEIESSPSAQHAFARGIGAPYYAAGGSFGDLPSLTKVQPLSG